MEKASAEKEGDEAEAQRLQQRETPRPQRETLSSQLPCAWGGPCAEDAFVSFEGRPSSHTRRTVCCLEPLPYSDVIRFLQKKLAQPGL